MTSISGLSEIIDAFDAILIDQYGVLHDGTHAFPDTIACLEALAHRGVPMVALTNSGKRAALNAARLARLGFPERLFQGVVSSGELAHVRLGEMLAHGVLNPGDGVAVIARDGDLSMLEGHPLSPIGLDPAARLLIIAGVEPERISHKDYLAAMAPLAQAGVPALCINPDLQIYSAGGRAFGPGQLARDYVGLGGDVTHLGKPGEEMFRAGLALLGNPRPARTLMIGDSPEHDIAGAQKVGVISLLIKGGVQANAKGPVADYAMDRLRF